MLTALDIYYLIKELKFLEGGKVDNTYHFTEYKRILYLQLHVPSKGKYFLKIQVPDFMYIGDSKEIGTMTGFGMMLRKYLEGARIRSITQKDFERIVEIAFERKEEEYRLIFELFSKGNIIFCDKEKILGIIEEQEWRDRKLKRLQPYEYPKTSTNILTIEFQTFFDKIKTSNKESLVKSLAMDFSIGGVYAEWICRDSNIDKDKKVYDMTLEELQKIYDSIKKLRDMDIDACVFEKKAHPFKINDTEGKKFVTFSEAIASLDVDQDSEKRGKELERLGTIIREQELSLADAEKEYLENQKKAEHIYHKYQEIYEILKKVNELRKKHSWKEIKEMMPEIKDIEEKNHRVTIDI